METILCSHRKNKGTYTLVLNILNKSDDISHLPQIKWGNDHEKDAINAFISDVASQHVNGVKGNKQCDLFIKPDSLLPLQTECIIPKGKHRCG